MLFSNIRTSFFFTLSTFISKTYSFIWCSAGLFSVLFSSANEDLEFLRVRDTSLNRYISALLPQTHVHWITHKKATEQTLIFNYFYHIWTWSNWTVITAEWIFCGFSVACCFFFLSASIAEGQNSRFHTVIHETIINDQHLIHCEIILTKHLIGSADYLITGNWRWKVDHQSVWVKYVLLYITSWNMIVQQSTPHEHLYFAIADKFESKNTVHLWNWSPFSKHHIFM